jgi:hypothetical protein
VKATAASVAIRAGAAGRFILDASEREGGALAPPGAPPAAPGSAGPAGCGPSGMVESATRPRAAGRS